jgi:hypothetical protein
MDKETRLNLTASDTWIRGIFMLFFIIVYSLAIGIWYLPSNAVLDFSESLSAYIYEILLYVSFSSQDRPFPFGPWPGEQDNYIDEQPGVTDDIADEVSDETDIPTDDTATQEADVTAEDSAEQASGEAEGKARD